MKKNDLISILQGEIPDLFEQSKAIRNKWYQNKVYIRGLIEISNICEKNCLYCGIRKDNKEVRRYSLTDDEVLNCVQDILYKGLKSIVIQGGEIESSKNSNRFTALLEKIRKIAPDDFGITLSLGEQSKETYKSWLDAGANRYLLRIESTNKDLFYKIHPHNELHSYERRLKALEDLKLVGYQVGTGVMIGLPFQTVEDLANDLLFFKKFEIDMVGMGPYLLHHQTPLKEFSSQLMSDRDKLALSLRMIAALRLLMPTINIASTTALETLSRTAKWEALMFGANVMMPNFTPLKYREEYFLYDDKVCIKEQSRDLFETIKSKALEFGLDTHQDTIGTSLAFKN